MFLLLSAGCRKTWLMSNMAHVCALPRGTSEAFAPGTFAFHINCSPTTCSFVAFFAEKTASVLGLSFKHACIGAAAADFFSRTQFSR